MRTVESALRPKRGDVTDNPPIFTEPRVGYRMPKGDIQENEGNPSLVPELSRLSIAMSKGI